MGSADGRRGVLAWLPAPESIDCASVLRGLVKIVSVCIAIALLWMGQNRLRADLAFASARHLEPKGALTAVLKAYEIDPWPMVYRQQAILSLVKVLDDKTVRITPEGADAVWRASLSAGRHPATLMARAVYLMKTGGDPEPILDELKLDFPRQTMTWALDADRARFLGDAKRLARAETMQRQDYTPTADHAVGRVGALLRKVFP